MKKKLKHYRVSYIIPEEYDEIEVEAINKKDVAL